MNSSSYNASSDFFKALEAVCVSNDFKTVTQRSLFDIMIMMGKAQYKPGDTFFTAFQTAFHSFRTPSPVVCDVIAAMRALSLSPKDDLLEKFELDIVAKRFQGCDAPSMARLIEDLTHWHTPNQAFLTCFTEACLSLDRDSFQGHHIADILTALAKVGHEPSTAFRDYMEEVCLSHGLESCHDPSDLIMIIHSLSSFKTPPTTGFLNGFDAVWSKTNLAHLSIEDLSLIVKAFSQLGRDPDVAFWQQWESMCVVAGGMHGTELGSLVIMMEALLQLNHKPGKDFLCHFEEGCMKVSPPQDNRSSSRTLFAITRGLTLLEHMPSSTFFHHLEKACECCLGDFSLSELISILRWLVQGKCQQPFSDFLRSFESVCLSYLRISTSKTIVEVVRELIDLRVEMAPLFWKAVNQVVSQGNISGLLSSQELTYIGQLSVVVEEEDDTKAAVGMDVVPMESGTTCNETVSVLHD